MDRRAHVTWVATLALALIPESSTTTHIVKPLNLNTGLYYELLKQVRWIVSDWKLMAILNIDEITHIKPSIEKLGIDKRWTRCKKIVNPEICNSHIKIEDYKQLSFDIVK